LRAAAAAEGIEGCADTGRGRWSSLRRGACSEAVKLILLIRTFFAKTECWLVRLEVLALALGLAVVVVVIVVDEEEEAVVGELAWEAEVRRRGGGEILLAVTVGTAAMLPHRVNEKCHREARGAPSGPVKLARSVSSRRRRRPEAGAVQLSWCARKQMGSQVCSESVGAAAHVGVCLVVELVGRGCGAAAGAKTALLLSVEMRCQ
jgi:hypothetical protein